MDKREGKHGQRLYEIDLLRFLAALSVVLYHYTYWANAAQIYPLAFPGLDRITKYGYLGVELFFIISGYVVLMSAQGKTVRQFLVSRVTRLYPAFWIACILTFAVKMILWQKGGYLAASPGQFIYNMTMLHEFFGVKSIDGAYWSLTIEITFYFLMSLLIAYKLMPHIDYLLIGWVGIVAITSEGTGFGELFFIKYAPYFIAGVLFFLIQSKPTLLRFGLLVAAYGLSLLSATKQGAELSQRYHTHFSPWVIAGTITLFYVLFYLVSSRRINLGQFPWLKWPGALTYPLYLIHSDIALVIFQYTGHRVDKYVLLGGMLVIMLIGAYLIHVLIEKKFAKPLGGLMQKGFDWMDGTDKAKPASGPVSNHNSEVKRSEVGSSV